MPTTVPPSTPPAPYDLLLFDLDGTLVDSAGDIAAALNHALGAHGLATHGVPDVIPMIGEGVRELVRKAIGPSPARAVDDALVEELVVTLRAYYRAHAVVHTRLYPGVVALLEGLAPSLKLAIATNKPGYLARMIVDQLGIARHFPWVLGEDDVGARKPDPRIVEELLARTGVPASRTLFIGDSPVDAATARAAGVDLCLVTWGYAPRDVIAGLPATFRIDSFDELLRVLR